MSNPCSNHQSIGKRMTTKEAVDKTMAEVGANPDYHAYLKYYPTQTGDKTIDKLTR